MITLLLSACSDRPSNATPTTSKIKSTTGIIAEVSPPATIQKLNQLFDHYEPQLKILSPTADQIINDQKVAVKLEVKDLPIFKNAQFDLGSHVDVILDNQVIKSSYDLSQPLEFDQLTVGTHTLRAIAQRPWHESFKNESAYAQVTFHVYSKTGEHTPAPQLPLLTYNFPLGDLGAEPILLDFHLHNAPLHLAAVEDQNLTDWRIRATVNEEQFVIDQWHPIYLKGIQPGKNVVKLELLDSKGAPIDNQFNSTAHLINYQAGGKDTLSRLLRGEAIAGIEAIVDPKYELKALPEASSPATVLEAAPPSVSAPSLVPPEPMVQDDSQAVSQSVSQSLAKSQAKSQSVSQSLAQSLAAKAQAVSQSVSQSLAKSQAKSQSVSQSLAQSLVAKAQAVSQSLAKSQAKSQSLAQSLAAKAQAASQSGSKAKSRATSQSSIAQPSWLEKITQKRDQPTAIPDTLTNPGA
ncbi:MAG: hypothetical protein SFT94_03015 [Pseudanabaenaceae cyanobacterium bins.68]|nr:hypothetical protein [Pseudanabaenaceae cyanobacterium bins.68]